MPILLQSLPEQRTMAEVWCGSEFTLVVDNEEGHVWGCGWNEHGNLGIGPVKENSSNIVSDWTRVQRNPSPSDSSGNDYLQIHVWEGSLACGGGHIIAISE
jgi:hypothetical protein